MRAASSPQRNILRLSVNRRFYRAVSYGEIANEHDAPRLPRSVLGRVVGPVSKHDRRIVKHIEMLKSTYCIERAGKAEDDSHCVGDVEAQAVLRRIAASWRRLAESCQQLECVETAP